MAINQKIIWLLLERDIFANVGGHQICGETVMKLDVSCLKPHKRVNLFSKMFALYTQYFVNANVINHVAAIDQMNFDCHE